MSDVPSNLIPTRITSLPDAPVASEDGLLLFVYQGNNYKVRAGDLLNVAGVPTSRQVIAGTGMTGGGALSSNVTLGIAPGGVNTALLNATGATPGTYGDSTNIPVFTLDASGRVTSASSVPATLSGYVPTSRQVVASDGLSGGGTLNSNVTLSANFSSSLPLVGYQSGVVGTSVALSRGDHKHPAVDLSADDQVDNLLGLSNGGTAKSLVPAAGALVWSGADGLYIGSTGLAGQVAISGGSGAPTWGSAILASDQAANLVYAGPTSGPAAPVSFRTLVNADLPASGVTANTYGSSTTIPVLTVNAEGVITSATTAAFATGLTYCGTWNASSNTPTLASSTGTNGYYYVVSVAGTTNLNRVTDWQVGDWAIFNGSSWQKLDQTNSVVSVNGYTGVVSLGYADLSGSIPTWNQNTTGYASALKSATTTVDTASASAPTTGQVLTATSGSAATWQTPTTPVTTFSGGSTGLLPSSATTGAVTLTGTLLGQYGGTGVANTGKTITLGGNLTTSGAFATTLTSTATTAVTLPTSGNLLSSVTAVGAVSGTPSSTTYLRGDGTWSTAVTSVAMSVPAFLSVAGSPITGSGTLAVTLSGTALPIANGGTNSTATATAGGAAYGTGTAYALTAAGTAGQVLTSTGASAPTWSGISGGTF